MENLAVALAKRLLTDGVLSVPLEKDTRMGGLFESPIEVLLFKAMWLAVKNELGQHTKFVAREPRSIDEIYFMPQRKIGKYRVDCLVMVCDKHGTIKKLVIECDGHEFHEKNKTQAAKDKQKDRELQMMGYSVFRFTGSELNVHALDCALQILSWAKDASGEGGVNVSQEEASI